MKTNDDVKIAGDSTVGDWNTFRLILEKDGTEENWEHAYITFFLTRLGTRYFEPIEWLKTLGGKEGEGFSIVALQCTLIEFLASTYFGKKYKLCPGQVTCDEHEYCRSGDIFRKFLQTAPVFKDHFADERKAHEFYKNVRCPLLHEARTKGGWTIRASNKTAGAIAINWDKKRVYRNDFQLVFEQFVEAYHKELLKCPELQKAFIRKFKSLCEE